MENDNGKNCYTSQIISKNGLPVLCFADSQAMFSKYDPLKENSAYPYPADCGLLVIAGIGNGYHIGSILKRNQKILIIGIESNQQTLETALKSIPQRDFFNRFIATTSANLTETLIKKYHPAIYGNISLVFHTAWAAHNDEIIEEIKTEFGKALSVISADFSVQSHFGAVWQRNILRNLQLADKITPKKNIFPLEKTALVIAAGPSLDAQIENIVKNRKKNYLIATDTALLVLLQNNIIPDACISIDGQNISYQHFMQDFPCKTLAIVDLCAHPAFALQAKKANAPILFTYSKHPLCQLVAEFYSKKNIHSFVPIDATAGTVTLAAMSFAQHVGFSSIKTIGADFAYIQGKPYARGTYLDTAFYNTTYRLQNAETDFTHLLYRTEVFPHPKGITTRVLQNYQKEFDKFSKKCVDTSKNYDIIREIVQSLHYFSDFIVWYKNKLSVPFEKMDSAIFFSILPYMAWIKKNGKKSELELSFDEICNALCDYLYIWRKE